MLKGPELKLAIQGITEQKVVEDALPNEIPLNKAPMRLHIAQKCYVCKREYNDIHTFYHSMCSECASYNFAKRSNTADLTGKYALVTGGRTKIGAEAVVSLLQNGATVYVTTRFPKNSIERFSQDPSYHEWKDRLHIVCLDLKVPAAVEEFCEFLN